MSRTSPSHGTQKRATEEGSYRNLFQLAAGGMGTVDLALKQEGPFQRLYAIKRLHTHLQSDEEFRAMFLDEARVAGMVRHPNVVSVLDYGQDADGPFLVMDYIDGISLGRLMGLAHKQMGTLPLQACLRIMLRVGEGLRAVHELSDPDGELLQLVHRDLSPQNILVSFDGSVLLTDFGIAKALGSSSKTATGVLKGKMGYMSPEQLQYLPVSPQSDLFSFGVVLYELLAGERLYKNRTDASAAQRILHEPVRDIGELRPDTPPELVELLFRLLAKSPEHRPESAREVVALLDAALSALVATEPPIRLDSVVEEFAGEDSRLRRSRVKRALNEPIAVAAPTPRKIALWVPALAIALGSLAIGALLGGMSQEPAVEEESIGIDRAPPVASAGSAAEPDENAPDENAPAAPSAEPVRVATPMRASSEASAVESAADPQVPRRSNARRASRREARRRAAAMSSMSEQSMAMSASMMTPDETGGGRFGWDMF